MIRVLQQYIRCPILCLFFQYINMCDSQMFRVLLHQGSRRQRCTPDNSGSIVLNSVNCFKLYLPSVPVCALDKIQNICKFWPDGRLMTAALTRLLTMFRVYLWAMLIFYEWWLYFSCFFFVNSRHYLRKRE